MAKTKLKPQGDPEIESKIVVVPVTDLEQIEKAADLPVQCEVLIHGIPYRFEGRRLVPAEQKEVSLLLKAAFPPEQISGIIPII